MEKKAEYITESEVADALEMLGKGYENPIEIHAPHTVLEMGDNYELQATEKGAWIKLSVSFRDVIKYMKGAKLAVFLAIALGINKSGESYPAFDTVAEWTGYSRRAVASAISELEIDGFLKVIRGEKKSNLYHIDWFAAFGSGNDPTSAKIAPVQKTTQTSAKNDENLSQIALKQDSINKNNNQIGANAPDTLPVRKPTTIEEAIYSNQPVTPDMLDGKQARMQDAANLMDMGCPGAYALAYAFMQARDIIIPTSKVKGQRKAAREMLEMNVRAEHITEATKSLLEKGMTVTDLFSVSKTAINLANPTPESNGYNPQGLSVQ